MSTRTQSGGGLVIRRDERWDVQGLRALAVLAVVGNHVLGWPAGGFLGVDVFFVLSGYLITGLLLREHARTGRVGLADFYRRRVRRIVPAAVVVIAVTVAATYLLANTARGRTVAGDGLWALLFASNWHYAMIGTDYWATDAVSPLQHYWSLAVEEQFYLVWPWLLLGVSELRRRSARTTLLPRALWVVVLASFGYSLWHTAASPTWAYFSTFDRGWELAVGALVAVLTGPLRRLQVATRVVVGWAGLAGTVIALFVVHSDSGVPAPWAAVPVCSTALVLAAGVAGPQPWLVPLVNPVARYVGDISYSVYLWHFPVLVGALMFFPARGLKYDVWVLGLTAALSIASFHFLEAPVRASSWLEPRRVRETREVRPQAPRPRVARTGRRRPAAAVVSVAALTAVCSMVVRGPEVEASAAAAPGSKVDVRGQGLLAARQQHVEEALARTTYPSLVPGVDRLGIDRWRRDLAATIGCYDVSPRNLDTCVNGGRRSRSSAVVVGDSVAMSYMPGLLGALLPRGFRVQQLTFVQCPSWDVAVKSNTGAPFAACDRFHRWSNEVVRRQRPDLVVLVSAYLTGGRLASGAQGPAAYREIQAGLTRRIQQLRRSARRVVVLEPAPQTTASLQECVTRFGHPSDCVFHIGPDYTAVERAERSAAAAAGATFIGTRAWYCDRRGNCPGFIGHTPMRVDRTHLTIPASRMLAPLLRSRLTGRAGHAGRSGFGTRS